MSTSGEFQRASSRVVSVNEGSLAADLNDAANVAIELASDRDFEFRVLEIPALNFTAAHLVSLIGSSLDQYLPLGALFDENEEALLRPLRGYGRSELVGQLSRFMESRPGS